MKNARIRDVSLSAADHGILTLWLDLDYGGSGQGFGGICLYNPNFPDQDIGGVFLWRLLETLEVTKLKDLVGLSCRVKAEAHKVHEIGHYLKDQWFNPFEEFKEKWNA